MSCRADVLPAMLRQCVGLVELHSMATPRCIYYRIRSFWPTDDPFRSVPDIVFLSKQQCLYTPVRVSKGYRGLSVCLLDRKNAVCVIEVSILLMREGVRSAVRAKIFSFALGDGFCVVRPGERWLLILNQLKESFSGGAWSQQARYINTLRSAEREDAFAQYLLEALRDYPRRVLHARVNDRDICLHCLPEWFGWQCAICQNERVSTVWHDPRKSWGEVEVRVLTHGVMSLSVERRRDENAIADA